MCIVSLGAKAILFGSAVLALLMVITAMKTERNKE